MIEILRNVIYYTVIITGTCGMTAGVFRLIDRVEGHK